MRNPLQEQLLKAGLVNKAKAAQVVREQSKQRHGKAPAPPAGEQVDAQRLQAERAERDRQLSAERNAQARAHERRAQIRQIVEAHKVKREGEITYRFSDGDSIRSVLVNTSLRAQLASGTLVIVRHEQGYELLPRVAVDKVRERDAGMIVLDHAPMEPAPLDRAPMDQAEAAASGSAADEDDYYRQFPVPDDLVW